MKTYGQFYSLLKQVCTAGHMDAQETKERFVKEVSLGRTGHVSELSDVEYEKLVECLKSVVGSPKTDTSTTLSAPEVPGDRIRKSIFSMCYTMNIINTVMSNTQKLKAIDKFIAEHPKIGNKHPLMRYTVEELNKLHHQFEVFTKHYLRKLG